MFGIKKKKSPFPEKRLYSIDEYLEIEGRVSEIYEFWNEWIIELNQLDFFKESITKFEKILSESVAEKNYKVVSNFLRKKKKVWIESENCLFYPDLFVVEGEIEYYPNREDIIINPLTIFEVSTQYSIGFIGNERGDQTILRDRTNKFWMYQKLSSLKEYVLITDIGSSVVETYNKLDCGSWTYQLFTEKENNLINFESFGIKLPVTELYL